MAIKRVIESNFWNSQKAMNTYTPEDKFFYLYLMTNPFSTQLGIYMLPIKTAALQLGYNVDTIEFLLDRFQNHHHEIIWNEETSEVYVKGLLSSTLMKGGKPVVDLLIKELRDVKDASLALALYEELIENRNSIVKTLAEFRDTILYSYLEYNNINIPKHNITQHDTWYDTGYDSCRVNKHDVKQITPKKKPPEYIPEPFNGDNL